MGSGCVCETSVWLPRFHIPHHPRAMSSTTTKPSANNLRAIWFRCSLLLVAWKLEFSSCVELTPRRETDGDESAMNLRGRHRLEAYSPKSVEVGSCELRLYGVLRSSRQTRASVIMQQQGKPQARIIGSCAVSYSLTIVTGQ
jgi:hypothetical protein